MQKQKNRLSAKGRNFTYRVRFFGKKKFHAMLAGGPSMRSKNQSFEILFEYQTQRKKLAHRKVFQEKSY